MKVVCVLKSGGNYNSSHVDRLERQVLIYNPMADFICLTDEKVKCESIPLKQNWPGWWSKIELFDPDLNLTDFIYLDLDVAVVGDLTPLMQTSFTMCADFIKPEQKNSSVMAWGQAPSEPFLSFKQDPVGFQEKYRRWPKIGDQAMIEDFVPQINTFNPVHVLSYKYGDVKSFLPADTAVVAFHGNPKPWHPEVQQEWAL